MVSKLSLRKAVLSQKGKESCKVFLSHKSENSIGERIRELTGRSMIAATPPGKAREILIAIPRGWGYFFAYSTDASSPHPSQERG